MAPLQGIPLDKSGVITTGDAGIAFAISLLSVSIILIGPLLASAPKMLPGFSISSKLTMNTFDP